MLSFGFLVVGLVVGVLGAPVEKRASSTENELQDGDCRDVTFIMARGSTEIGNMVSAIKSHIVAVTKHVKGKHCWTNNLPRTQGYVRDSKPDLNIQPWSLTTSCIVLVKTRSLVKVSVRFISSYDKIISNF